jgi:hypothetical protein
VCSVTLFIFLLCFLLHASKFFLNFVLNQNNWLTVTLKLVLFTCVFHVCHIVFLWVFRKITCVMFFSIFKNTGCLNP